MRRPTTQLSEGECRVLEALAADGPNSLRDFKDVALYLGRSVNTVKTQALRAYAKLHTNEKAEAVRRHRRLRGHLCEHLRVMREREAAI